jgi:Nif-specific regulatory protein
LHVEPLRARRSDIPILAKFFLERFARRIGRALTDFTPAALEALRQYDWPGNVRELQNTIERAVILTAGPMVGLEDIQLSSLGRSSSMGPNSAGKGEGQYHASPLDEVEQEHILATLEFTRWNKSQAAQILGIERSTLDRKLKKYELEKQHKMS